MSHPRAHNISSLKQCWTVLIELLPPLTSPCRLAAPWLRRSVRQRPPRRRHILCVSGASPRGIPGVLRHDHGRRRLDGESREEARNVPWAVRSTVRLCRTPTDPSNLGRTFDQRRLLPLQRLPKPQTVIGPIRGLSVAAINNIIKIVLSKMLLFC